jgi:hypothetical protein
MDQIVEKEIAETTSSISSQHAQCQWYVQTYLVAITGLFAIAAFFAKDGKLSVQASAVGVVYSLVVFFMGWVFLSVIAHKVAMIHMLYKHVAGMRELRAKAHPELESAYVLPKGRTPVKYGSLIGQLPYLFFAFNFVLFAGGLSFFLAPHTRYHQTVAVVVAICTLLGTFYPIVCISFNKHLSCASKARNMRHKQLLENHWTRAVRDKKRRFWWLRFSMLTIANFGALLMALYAYVPQTSSSERAVILLCYAGLLGYGLVRYAMEKWRLKIGVEAIKVGGG